MSAPPFLPSASRNQDSPKALAWAVGGIALSAVLLAAAAPGIGGVPILAFVAFAPWLASLSRLGIRGSALSGLLMGYAYIVPGRWDSFAAALSANAIEGMPQFGLMLLFFLGFAMPFALFGLADAWRRRHLRLPAAVAAVWRAALLASLICGLWSPFAYTPASFLVDFEWLLPVAAWMGEVLLLVALLWPAAALAEAAGAAGLRRITLLIPPLLGLGALGMGGALAVSAHDQAWASGLGQRMKALPLQLDLPHRASQRLLDRDRSGNPQSALELSLAGLAAQPQCELVVWPETPVEQQPSQQVCAQGGRLAERLGRPLLAQCYRPSADQEAGDLITAEWFGGGAAQGFHAKSALVPFYEKPLWGPAGFASGSAGTLFELDSARRLIPALCYELHAGPQVRAGALSGAQFIVHMASFTPFARHPVDLWDLGMSRIRAAEYRLPIVRAANRGASGWIDAIGRPQQLSPRLGRHSDCAEVWSPAAAPTLYARLGPIASWLPALLAAALAFAAAWRERFGAAPA